MCLDEIRSRYNNAQKTLQAFSARLRDETDLNQLSDDIVEVVQKTLQPAHVALWLCDGGRRLVEQRSEASCPGYQPHPR